MVERYCFVKLRDEHVGNRAALAEALRAMLIDVAGVERVTVGVPADDSAASLDLSLVLRAASLERWRAIAADDLVREVVEVWLPEHAVVVKAWTFEVGPT